MCWCEYICVDTFSHILYPYTHIHPPPHPLLSIHTLSSYTAICTHSSPLSFCTPLHTQFESLAGFSAVVDRLGEFCEVVDSSAGAERAKTTQGETTQGEMTSQGEEQQLDKMGDNAQHATQASDGQVGDAATAAAAACTTAAAAGVVLMQPSGASIRIKDVPINGRCFGVFQSIWGCFGVFWSVLGCMHSFMCTCYSCNTNETPAPSPLLPPTTTQAMVYCSISKTSHSSHPTEPPPSSRGSPYKYTRGTPSFSWGPLALERHPSCVPLLVCGIGDQGVY